MIYYNATADNVSALIENRWRQVSLKTDQGQKLLAALRKNPQDADEIATIANVVRYVTKITQGRIQVCSDDKIRIDNRVVDYGMRDVILRVMSEAGEFATLSKFLENVDENPNKGIAEHIYSFISKGGMPFTEDGHFLAFKRVRDDFKSFHAGAEEVSVTNAQGETATFSGNIPHWVGATLVMERALCDGDRNRTCSVGLHACSYPYLPQYCGSRGRVMIVKINPRDVVAIPNDYNDTKLRCCRLLVVGEVAEDEAQSHFTSAVDTRYDSEFEETEDDEVEEITVDDVRHNAVEDAKYDINVGGVGGFDPTEGASYYDTPEDLKSEYRMAYAVTFEDECDLDEFYSEKAYRIGFEDGASLGGLDRNTNRSKEDFMPDPQDGSNFYHMPDDHEDTYIVGFIRGYLKAWNVWADN